MTRANTATVTRRHSALAASKAARALGTSCLVADANSPLVDFGVCQVFARRHIGVAYALGRSAGRLDCPNEVADATSTKRDFAIVFSALFPRSVP